MKYFIKTKHKQKEKKMTTTTAAIKGKWGNTSTSKLL